MLLLFKVWGFSLLNYLFIFYWSTVDLQCVSFRCTAKWFSYRYMYLSVCIYIHISISILFQILFHYSLLQDIEYSSLCYTVSPYCLSILYISLLFSLAVLPQWCRLIPTASFTDKCQCISSLISLPSPESVSWTVLLKKGQDLQLPLFKLEPVLTLQPV